MVEDIGEYRGCRLLFYPAPPSPARYGSPCTTYMRFDLDRVKADIDAIKDVKPQAWEYHSTYRGIEIKVYMPGATHYTAYYDGGWHMAASLSTVQTRIDEFLEEPPADGNGAVALGGLGLLVLLYLIFIRGK